MTGTVNQKEEKTGNLTGTVKQKRISDTGLAAKRAWSIMVLLVARYRTKTTLFI